MALTPDNVRKIATLARLRLSPDEERVFTQQLGRIINYIDQLQKYETGEGSAPMGPASGGTAREAEDLAQACLPRELFLANAPASAMGEFLVVPEVMGGGGDA